MILTLSYSKSISSKVALPAYQTVLILFQRVLQRKKILIPFKTMVYASRKKVCFDFVTAFFDSVSIKEDT
jgi:hypothetical protein